MLGDRMSVLLTMKWYIPNQKVKEYTEWAKGTIPKVLEAPGLVEFRAYRAGAASRHVLVIFEIESKEAFSKFWEFLQKEKLLDEVYANTVDAVSELWGPSPLVPEPLRPKK